MSESVKKSVQSVKDLVETAYLSLRSPPIAPDGYYDWQVDPAGYTHQRKLLARYVDKLAPITSKAAKPQLGAKIAVRINPPHIITYLTFPRLLLTSSYIQKPRMTV